MTERINQCCVRKLWLVLAAAFTLITYYFSDARTHAGAPSLPTTGPRTTRKYFFDAQTSLLLRRLTTTDTLLAPLPEQVDFEDYREVGGVKLPFTIRTSGVAAFTTATRRFTDVRLNVIVDDTIFKQPGVEK